MNQEELNNEEISLSDGQADNLQPLPEMSEAINPAALPGGCSETMTIDERYYTQGEFESAFNEFLTFLKSPETSLDAFESLRAQGQSLAAGKIYKMAQNYRFLRFLIDRRTQLLHDFALISIFASCEANAIVYNWTGISLAEKVKIWLRGKIKQRAEQAQMSGKHSVWGFLGRRAVEKPQKPAN